MRRVLLAALALVVLATGCTAAPPAATPTPTESGGPTVSEAFSIAGLLAAVPLVDGPVLVSAADVDAAAEAAGLERPTEVDDALLDWITTMSGIRVGDAVSVPWAESLAIAFAARHDEYVASVGFGIPDVTAFLEVGAPPSRFAIFDGEFDLAAVTAAIGDPVDGLWAQPGDDLAVDLELRNRPDPLGRPVRVVGDESRLAMTLSTPSARQYLAGEAGDWADLLALAEALDDAGVQVAQLWAAGDDVVGVGIDLAAPGEAVVVRIHADDATAAAAAEAVVGLDDGSAHVAAAEASGRAVLSRIEWTDPTAPAALWSLLARRSPVLG